MPLTFYHQPYSTADITKGVLAELEYDNPAAPLAERVTVYNKNGDTKTPQYLALNPNGKVPTLVHDGISIWESAAITMYLGELFGEARGLYPALGPRRGEAMKWIVWTNVVLATAILRVRAIAAEAGEEATANVKADVEKALQILEGGLKGRDFLLGERYCLADTHLWFGVRSVSFVGMELGEYPTVKAWADRVAARPALEGT